MDDFPLPPALVFQRRYLRRSKEGCEGEDKLPHWNIKFLSRWISGNTLDEDPICKVSYKDVFLAASIIAQQLASICTTLDCTSAPIIGISIPEGPYLIVAVLAVHLFQIAHTSCCSTGNTCDHKESCNAILVPLDPREGKDRLSSMVSTLLTSTDNNRSSILALILVMPGNDFDKMQQIVGNSQQDGTTTTIVVDITSCFNEDKCGEQSMNCNNISINPIAPDDEKTATLPFHCPLLIFNNNNQQTKNYTSHIVFTSGSTGKPKGCASSISSLMHYIRQKIHSHEIIPSSKVFLASSLSFDPCFSDILSTFFARATLAIAPSFTTISSLGGELQTLSVTHILCTPSLWSLVEANGSSYTNDAVQFGSLQIVALGGEPIPKYIVQRWARRRPRSHGSRSEDAIKGSGVRLLATYGVTEACVYQTIGEIFNEDETFSKGPPSSGQNVGIPFSGIHVFICKTLEEAKIHNSRPIDLGSCKTSFFSKTDDDDNILVYPSSLHPVENTGDIGEVVLYGAQLDVWSGYWNNPDLTNQKFYTPETTCFYRTGDLGYLHDRELFILGRINGEDSMVKFNGVRLELGEIEAAIRDKPILKNRENEVTSQTFPVVLDCRAIITTLPITENDQSLPKVEEKKLIAYCVLSPRCRKEIGWRCPNQECNTSDTTVEGMICPASPLLTLLRYRCIKRVAKGCTPSAFVLINRIPLSPTGKTDKRLFPSLENCSTMDDRDELLLTNHGRCGKIVAKELCLCLNLQNNQLNAVKTTSTIATLGGDSLAVTRFVRSLYALHHGINNTRTLGGEYGRLVDDIFNLKHFFRCKNLGEWVSWLDSNDAFCKSEWKEQDDGRRSVPPGNDTDARNDGEYSEDEGQLHDSLIQAIMESQTSVATAILSLGISPHYGNNMSRLSKISHRLECRNIFQSTPLHISCTLGNDTVVADLVKRGWNAMIPDASGNL